MHLLDKLLEVFSPLGRKTIVDSEVWDCVISFDRHGLVTDLTTLDMGKFDAILGMDWLSIWHSRSREGIVVNPKKIEAILH